MDQSDNFRSLQASIVQPSFHQIESFVDQRVPFFKVDSKYLDPRNTAVFG